MYKCYVYYLILLCNRLGRVGSSSTAAAPTPDSDYAGSVFFVRPLEEAISPSLSVLSASSSSVKASVAHSM